MATASLTTTPTTLDAGTGGSVSIRNTGNTYVTVTNGGQRDTIRPGRRYDLAVQGPVTVSVPAEDGGSGSVSYDVSGGRADPVTYDELSTALAAKSTTDSNTYATHAAARPGNRTVWLGDSLTQWQDGSAAANAPTSTASHSMRVCLANLGSILSNQRALYVADAGIGGNTTTQMLARFDTDVTPWNPKFVHILGGTNDPSTELALTLSNLAAIVAKTRAIGAVPILGLIPPANATSKSEQTNIGIRRLAASLGVAVIDYCEPLIDQLNGQILSALNRDGTHPNDAGFVAMAEKFAAEFVKIAPPWAPPLPQRNSATNNLVSNGLFLNLVGAAGTAPSGWVGGTGTGITTTTEAATLGNWVKIDCAAAPGNAQLYQNISTAPVAGHRYALLGKIKTSWTSGSGFHIRNRITKSDASTVDMMPMNNMGVTLPDGTFYCEYTCPADAASHQVSLFVLAGTGTLWVSQMALWDLTALGVA